MALVVGSHAAFSVAELWEMPDDGRRRELVDGALIVTPAPGFDHQDGLGGLYTLLRGAAPHELAVIIAPFDWVAGPRSLFQPDLLVARRSDVGKARLERAPVLAVEALSPSTRHIDLGLKRAAYEAAGVQHYWIVDPLAPSLLALRLVEGRYEEIASVTGDEPFSASEPFPITVIPAALLS